jgi:hypothetical protein
MGQHRAATKSLGGANVERRRLLRNLRPRDRTELRAHRRRAECFTPLSFCLFAGLILLLALCCALSSHVHCRDSGRLAGGGAWRLVVCLGEQPRGEGRGYGSYVRRGRARGRAREWGSLIGPQREFTSAIRPLNRVNHRFVPSLPPLGGGISTYVHMSSRPEIAQFT